MQDFEKLGAFYLGRSYDLAAGTRGDEPVLYDSRDLVTHGVCVGMTGSGKTGLCMALLEEAAIDGIPALVIDPKGDLGNLLLAFPSLAPADFRPWVEPAEAARRGLTPDALAEQTAETWRRGLAAWGQDGARVARVDELVHPPQEGDRLEVLAAAVLVGRPVPLALGVVEVEHRGDGVDAQSVDVVPVEPEQRVGEEEVGDLAPPVVEDERPPVAVLAAPRVGVLVEVRPVEAGEPVRVLREVGGHPVEDHADPFRVAPVDERHEVARETPRVLLQQRVHAIQVLGRDDEPGVVFLLHAIDDLGIGVGGRVGPRLAREGQNQAREPVRDRRQLEIVVKAIFGQRRKMIANAVRALASSRGLSGASALLEAGIDPTRRPEPLGEAVQPRAPHKQPGRP